VSAVQTTTEQAQESASQDKKPSKQKNAVKGPKVKLRGPAVNGKNTPATKNGERIIIGVNTSKKNSAAVPKKLIIDKSNENIKTTITDKIYSSKTDMKKNTICRKTKA